MAFDIFPAIDLRRGQVVRLQLGDPNRQTVFGNDPVETAKRWLDAGARWIHVVNLDGAFAEDGRANWLALEKLGRLGAQVQFGGGLRSLDDMGKAMDYGVSRAILGTAALENPELVSASIARYGPDRVAVGIDARDGRVRTRGWQNETAATPADLARAMGELGVRTIIYTDISRDGVLGGVNTPATVALALNSGLSVIASGGVKSLEDVAELAPFTSSGVAGVIIGRALYEGRVDLAAALALAEQR
jgi:phosphoribosylformimino-5-aminoimidazole carboxamide ribotide isomerase